MNPNKRINLLGINVDALSVSETLAEVERIINEKRICQHIVINAAKFVHAYYDNNLRTIINECDIINADGQAIVWAARFLGHPFRERVAGIDLMHDLLILAQSKDWSVYFLGAKEDILKIMIDKLKINFPQLKIAGYRHGYFKDKDEPKIVDQIKRSKPEIIFVGISSPKKENFLAGNLIRMGVPFAMGVGGSFDILAGITRRAPLILQKTGMEWVYRIYQEPGRMWKRYAKTNFLFIYLILKEKIRQCLQRKKN